jgi:hypothetical protein
VPGARNSLGPEQPIVQLKNLRVPAPEIFAKFANFTVIATLTRGILLPLGVVGHKGSTVIVVLNGLRCSRREMAGRQTSTTASKATLHDPRPRFSTTGRFEDKDLPHR